MWEVGLPFIFPMPFLAPPEIPMLVVRADDVDEPIEIQNAAKNASLL
jgi:hypothetical protein